MKCVIGIDTSCYTTSVAVMDEKGSLLTDIRTPLTVKCGNRGLAQSEMVYQHSRNLPVNFEKALVKLGVGKLDVLAVTASKTPRPLPDSYMPAFTVGEGYARVLAATHGAQLSLISHQENHIFAGVWSAKGPTTAKFLVLHVSGGTTEIVLVEITAVASKVCLLGGSRDISAGQFIDRIGVAMGFPFPAGPYIEAAAADVEHGSLKLPVAVRGLAVSFSGPETQANRLLQQGCPADMLAAAVQACVSTSLSQLAVNAMEQTGVREILLVGGVTANRKIRIQIAERIGHAGGTLYLPEPAYSPDNAVGCAYYNLMAGHIPRG